MFVHRLSLACFQCRDGFTAGVAQQRIAFAAQTRIAGAQFAGALFEPFAHSSMDFGIKQRFKYRFPLIRARRQQLAKAPLRQHDDLPELRAVKTQARTDFSRDVAGPGREGAPLAVLVAAFKLRFSGHLTIAFPALPRAALGRPTRGAIALLAQREFEGYFRGQIVRRVVAAHCPGIALAPRGVAI